MRSKGVGPENVEAGAKDVDNLDLDMALSKIAALTGMIRAQEEIEALLDRELDELRSKHAGTRESVWRLLTRYSKVLVDVQCRSRASVSYRLCIRM